MASRQSFNQEADDKQRACQYLYIYTHVYTYIMTYIYTYVYTCRMYACILGREGEKKKDRAGGTQTYRVCVWMSQELRPWNDFTSNQKCRNVVFGIWKINFKGTRVPSGSPKECASRIALSCQHCRFWRRLLKGWQQNEKWIGGLYLPFPLSFPNIKNRCIWGKTPDSQLHEVVVLHVVGTFQLPPGHNDPSMVWIK